MGNNSVHGQTIINGNLITKKLLTHGESYERFLQRWEIKNSQMPIYKKRFGNKKK